MTLSDAVEAHKAHFMPRFKAPRGSGSEWIGLDCDLVIFISAATKPLSYSSLMDYSDGATLQKQDRWSRWGIVGERWEKKSEACRYEIKKIMLLKLNSLCLFKNTVY